MLNVLTDFIPENERIVTIEDAAELQRNQRHWIALESKSPGADGQGEVTTRDLVRNVLRMRPDRIVVGEVRSGEALDMLQAMNTGHDGSLTTLHANSPRDVISRLETMALMAGVELPLFAIRQQMAAGTPETQPHLLRQILVEFTFTGHQGGCNNASTVDRNPDPYIGSIQHVSQVKRCGAIMGTNH